MPFACRITKASDTHSEYVIFIAFPWQQWLRERVSMLRYTYIASVVVLAPALFKDPVSCGWAVTRRIQKQWIEFDQKRNDINESPIILHCNAVSSALVFKRETALCECFVIKIKSQMVLTLERLECPLKSSALKTLPTSEEKCWKSWFS